MASVYLNAVGSDRTSALGGLFKLTRVPCNGEIVQVVDKNDEVSWFKVVNVVHSDRGNDPSAQIDAELFGEVMTKVEMDLIWRERRRDASAELGRVS